MRRAAGGCRLEPLFSTAQNPDALSAVRAVQDPNVIEAKVMVSSCGHDGPMGAAGEAP